MRKLDPPKAEKTAITGAHLYRLMSHHDHRGSFTESFRDEWGLGWRPIQWNVVRSAANVLRGVHVHRRHSDYLMIIDGRATIGLSDLRAGSPTEGVATTLAMDASQALVALEIPPGVAHGFLFHTTAMHLYSVSHYWDEADELGCQWNDPGLGIAWPLQAPTLSPRDAALGPLSALRAHVLPYRSMPVG